jgi:hypothetical protein
MTNIINSFRGYANAKNETRCVILMRDFLTVFLEFFIYEYIHIAYAYTQTKRVGPEVFGLTYKSRAKWKMLRGIYSAIYGEINVSV